MTQEELKAIFIYEPETGMLRDPFAWWCVESDCITRSAHVRDHWTRHGKTVVALYK